MTLRVTAGLYDIFIGIAKIKPFSKWFDFCLLENLPSLLIIRTKHFTAYINFLEPWQDITLWLLNSKSLFLIVLQPIKS